MLTKTRTWTAGLAMTAAVNVAVGPVPGAAIAEANLAHQCGGQPVTMLGTDGPDHLVGTSGADVIWAGPGNDIIRGGGGDDVVCAGSGADIVAAGAGKDDVAREEVMIFGGPGSDFIVVQGGGDVTVLAGKGADVIHDNATTRHTYSSLSGGMGKDTILGGHDGEGEPVSVYGGAGDDVIRARGAYAQIYTGPGHDVVYGGPGGSQVDDLTGDGDVYYGGAGGQDHAGYGFASTSGVRVSLVTGRGWRIGGGGRGDILIDVEGVGGTSYDDVIIGNAVANGLSGEGGNDVIRGRNGADDIWGGDGDDTLDGGLPDGTAPLDGDSLDGGNGTDTCTHGEALIGCEFSPEDHAR